MVQDFITVNVQIGNNVKVVKMQRGISFENRSGIFIADKNGTTIKMTNYQMKVFEAVANNIKEKGTGNGIVLSQEDIKAAQQKFKQGNFVADMSEFLPQGYKIEKPKMSVNDKYIEAYVTNGKESQSATLKFSYGAINNSSAPSYTNSTTTTIDKECLDHLDPDRDGKFELKNDYECSTLPFPVSSYAMSEQSYNNLMNKLKSLNGQKITPQLIDKMANILLDAINKTDKNGYKEDLTYAGEGEFTTDNALADIAKFGKYLTPATVDKLLKSGSLVSTKSENLKNLYSRLNTKQKEQYYNNILTPKNNTETYVFSTRNGETSQIDGHTTANLLFEKPLSSSTYSKVKNFVTAMNKPGNGITHTKTECKTLINVLQQKGQITPQQAKELLNAGQIK